MLHCICKKNTNAIGNRIFELNICNFIFLHPERKYIEYFRIQIFRKRIIAWYYINEQNNHGICKMIMEFVWTEPDNHG